MIRNLRPSEVSLMVEAGKAFFAEGKIPGTFNPEYFTAQWRSYIVSGTGAAIAKFGDDGAIHGALGAIFYTDPLTGDKVSVEQFFYMIREHRGGGLALLDEYERQAMERGCKRIAMIHLENLHPRALKRVYERRGFALMETGYLKELPH